MGRLLVIGSSNTDMVVKTDRFPDPGETVLGGAFHMFPGGKGANQAVAAARMGTPVEFICSLGDDLFGEQALAGYREEGLGTSHIQVLSGYASGVALITVDKNGENEIVVASGANAYLTPDRLKRVEAVFSESDMVLTQLEIPLPSVTYIAQYCREKAIPLILNPAPAQPLSDTILQDLYLITPNQTEAEFLSGIPVGTPEDAHAATRQLRAQGVRNVIVTMGASGAFYDGEAGDFLLPPPRVNAVDTTAAGDVFNGVLAAQLSQGISWRPAIEMANKAGAIAVTRLGAQSSAPRRDELQNT